MKKWSTAWFTCQFCSILLSTNGVITIARHIVWTISIGRAVDCGVIIVWNTHKICRRECARHGYHPLIPSLQIEWEKQQSTYDKRVHVINNIIWCDLVLFLLCLLLGVVVNMMIQQSWICNLQLGQKTEDSGTLEYLHSGCIMASKWIEDQVE